MGAPRHLLAAISGLFAAGIAFAHSATALAQAPVTLRYAVDTEQAKALNISRGSVYYLPRPVPEADLAIMRRLDRLHLEFPFAGSRMLRGLRRCRAA